MRFGTILSALATFSLVAMLLFGVASLTGIGPNPQSFAGLEHPKILVLERNLSSNLAGRIARSFATFVPLLALIVVALAVLDSITYEVEHSSAASTPAPPPELSIPTSPSLDFDEWPREFDLFAGTKGWIAVRREHHFPRYGGN